MWRIYCGSAEGIVIYTTIRRLAAALPPETELLPVRYDQGSDAMFGPLIYLATNKRPGFRYENEWRVVWPNTAATTTREQLPKSHLVALDPLSVIEGIRAHPASDATFRQRVVALLERVAPALADRLQPSEMADGPAGAFLDSYHKIFEWYAKNRRLDTR
jgi:hypothetical protein